MVLSNFALKCFILFFFFCNFRQKLRRLEVAVIEYRESLEERGIKNLEDIERKVSSYRRKLQSEYGLLGSSEGSNKQLSRKFT